jgi:hypothetical protein
MTDSEMKMVKERPIIMTAPSVQAILAGRKTQTRRLVSMDRLYVDVRREIVGEAQPRTAIAAGRHRVYLNPQGAVFAETPRGRFGLKPGEFHFRCPLVDGVTELRDVGGGKQRWAVVPQGPQRLWVKEAFWVGHDSDWDEASGRLLDCGVNLSEDKDAPVQYCATPENPDKPDEPGEWFEPDDIFPEREWVKWCGGGVGPSYWSKRSPLFMPRWASRINLEPVLAVLQPLHDLTREDVIAEGVFHTDYGQHEHQLSADGGRTFGVTRTQRAGWSYRKTTSHEQCLGSPQMAYANEWNRVHAGDRWNLKSGPSPWDQNPWVWTYTFRRES